MLTTSGKQMASSKRISDRTTKQLVLPAEQQIVCISTKDLTPPNKDFILFLFCFFGRIAQPMAKYGVSWRSNDYFFKLILVIYFYPFLVFFEIAQELQRSQEWKTITLKQLSCGIFQMYNRNNNWEKKPFIAHNFFFKKKQHLRAKNTWDDFALCNISKTGMSAIQKKYKNTFCKKKFDDILFVKQHDSFV